MYRTTEPDGVFCYTFFKGVERVSNVDTAVRAALASTGEAYELVACDPALADTASFCQAYGYSGSSDSSVGS